MYWNIFCVTVYREYLKISLTQYIIFFDNLRNKKKVWIWLNALKWSMMYSEFSNQTENIRDHSILTDNWSENCGETKTIKHPTNNLLFNMISKEANFFEFTVWYLGWWKTQLIYIFDKKWLLNKVRTFWEAHKIWKKNLPDGFDVYQVNQLICQKY